MNKIEEAQEILRDFGLPEGQRNKVSALTFLALCGIAPSDEWKNAYRHSMTLSKGIMRFVSEKYGLHYKQNTRESFRKDGLSPFLQHRMVELNPDNPNLSPQSANTHYAISSLVVETLKSYKTDKWTEALEKFKKEQFSENLAQTAFVQKISIKNFKSIENLELELGRLNVFIGANGSGKSNVLEAIAMIGASKANDLDLEGLVNRGVRIANPKLTISSFLGKQLKKEIKIEIYFDDKGETTKIQSLLVSSDIDDIYAKWFDKEKERIPLDVIKSSIYEKYAEGQKLSAEDLIRIISDRITQGSNFQPNTYTEILSQYAIFNLSTQTLRGLQSDSKKTPLGIYGEGLDTLLSNFNSYERLKLIKCKNYFSWLDEITLDKSDAYKHAGYKLGKSNSTLYFNDRFMQKKNNLFSAENANEGILHVIFYLALFISNKTPVFFAIDNIETALNPRLCRSLIKELAILAKERGKQALITTHNPAVLDGLNLRDESQRLFEVYRTDDGLTKVRRIRFKENVDIKPFKLSEMWMKGMLGAVPREF